jgi:hypothetical protein
MDDYLIPPFPTKSDAFPVEYVAIPGLVSVQASLSPLIFTQGKNTGDKWGGMIRSNHLRHQNYISKDAVPVISFTLPVVLQTCTERPDFERG